MKTCPRCATEKDLSAFNRDRSSHDGLFAWCRECANRQKAEGYRRNPGPAKARAAAYRARSMAEDSDGFRQARKRYYQENRAEIRARAKAARLADVEGIREQQREYYRKNQDAYVGRMTARRLGINLEEYQRLMAQAGGLCAICGKPPSGGRTSTATGRAKLHLDHCHRSGRVRGFLCRSCNLGLGHFGDCHETMTKAVAYLRGHVHGG